MKYVPPDAQSDWYGRRFSPSEVTIDTFFERVLAIQVGMLYDVQMKVKFH